MAEKSRAPKTTKTKKLPKNAVTPVYDNGHASTKAWNIGRLFWGLLLVLAGGLVLLGNIGVLKVELGELWKLWPLLIVATGLSLFSFRGWVGLALSTFLVVATLGLVTLVATGNFKSGGDNIQSIQIDKTNQKVNKAQVLIKSGAGKLDINSRAMDEVLAATVEGTRSELDYTSKHENSTQVTELDVSRARNWWRGSFRNDLTVDVTEQLPLDVTVDAGAANINVDLSKALLKSLAIQSGAGSIDVTLGIREDATVSIDAGASSVRIRVPRGAGVSAQVSGGLTSRNMADLRADGERFVTDGFDQAATQIRIDARLGVSSFTIERY